PILFSSGNNNGAVSYPSNRPEVISVGASSPCDERKQPGSCDGEWWGSNYGNALDIISPGVKIYTTDIMGSGGYTSGNYTSTFNGTSSACPGAAGLCSLIISYNTNLTAPQVQWILENAADDMVGEPSEESPGWDIYHGHGRINANQSMIRSSTDQNVRFFTVSNLGIGALIVYKISSTNLNPWIDADPNIFLLNPLQSQVVTVTVDDSLASFGTNNDFLQIYSDDADENPYSVPVTFFNYDLIARFTSDVTTGSSPLAVQFIDYSTGTIDSWIWDFGDGASSTLPSPEHTYTGQGTYTVQLTVTGSGRTNTVTRIDYILVDCGIALNADQITLFDNPACFGYQYDIDVLSETCSGVIAFLSTNTDVATVDAMTGVATGVAPGICQITASCTNDPSCFSIVDVTVDACPVIVPAPSTSPTFKPSPSTTPTPTLTSTPTSTPTPTPTSSENKEFLINTRTDNEQNYPVIGIDGDGNFVIAWESYEQDGASTGIFARRFSKLGNPLGNEFQVNTHYKNQQFQPTIAMNFSGNFVITWASMKQDGTSSGVFAQRFNKDGTPAGKEFQVNTYTAYDQWEPSVVMDKDGNFVIAWSSKYQDDYGFGIYAKRFDSQGNPLGDEFRVNTYWKRNQITPSVAMDNDGNFVIAWAGYRYSIGYDIYAQRYDKKGNPLGGEFRVNTYTTNCQNNPVVAVDSIGNFVITWASFEQDGSNYVIFAQRYNYKGSRLGKEIQVNTYTQDHQDLPTIAMDPLGNFLITWHSKYQDGSSYGIFAQLYDMNGNTIGNEFQVNTYKRSNQQFPSAAMTNLDYYVITWSSNQQASQDSFTDIFAKQYKDDSFGPTD
ncbi:S8 family serine peptidase, partial [bacterium]|nr:S8 family serine peptidase [bacterium]